MAIPAEIQALATKVRNEVYGRDVREAIAKSIEETGKTAAEAYEITQNLIDGTFDEGILSTQIEQKLLNLEAQYAPQLTSLTAELADKATVAQVNAMASGTPKLVVQSVTNLPASVAEGEEKLALVLDDGHKYYWNSAAWLDAGVYQAVKVAERSVSAEQTDFLSPSKNLFNKNDVIDSKVLDTTTGGLTDSTVHVTSNFIKIKPSTEYKRSHNAAINVYDANQNFVTSYPANTASITTHPLAAWARTSVSKANAGVYQLELGAVSTPYEEYGLKSPILKVSPINLSKEVDGRLTTTEQDLKKTTDSEYYGRELAYKKKFPSTVVTLLGTKDDQTKAALNIGMQNSLDYVKRLSNVGQSYSLRQVGTTFKGDLTATFSTPFVIPPAAVIGIAFYVDDKANIQNYTLQVKFADKPAVYTQIKSAIVSGWNYHRFSTVKMKPNVPLDATYLDDWGKQITEIKIIPQFIKDSSMTVGKVWVECPEKAQILFVNDGGYKRFLDLGYPDMKALNFPVTWALNPNKLGANVGTQAERITEAEVMQLALDGNSYFSFHSWDSQTLGTYTEFEVKQDALRCVRWLRARGLVTNDVFRGAVTQNNAPNWQGMKGVVQATRTWKSTRGFDAFPFLDRWNVPTDGIHGMIQPTYNTTDDYFRVLKETHSLVVLYVHGIDPTYSGDISQENWNAFMGHITTGVNEGWLEGVSYEMLTNRMETPQEVNDIETISKIVKA